MGKELIEHRSTQTKVKHTIQEKYTKSWGGIILEGLKGTAASLRKQGRPFDVHFVYVDCNASCGRYSQELEDVLTNRESLEPIFGSPIIGVRALDDLVAYARERCGINLRVNAILIERESRKFQELQQSLLMAGITNRVRETQAFSSLKNGEIAIVRSDSTTLTRDLITYTRQPHTFSLYLLDPYGPQGIPKSFVAPIINAPKHDVIINMPYQDLHKKSGLLTKSNLTEDQITRIHDYNAMFGHDLWQDLVKDLDAGIIWEQGKFPQADDQQNNTMMNSNRVSLARDREQGLMTCYQETLQSVDPHLTVKSIRLPFPDKDRTMFYLYLTTHDPTGALAMNDVLWKAGYQDRELRKRIKEVTKQQVGQMSFEFELPATRELTVERPAVEEIAADIMRHVASRKMLQRRELFQVLANESYFPHEVDSALKHLKKIGEVSFDAQLTHATFIRVGVA